MTSNFDRDPLGMAAAKRRQRRLKAEARIQSLERQIAELKSSPRLHTYFSGELAEILKAIESGMACTPKRAVSKYIFDLRSSNKYKSVAPEIKQQAVAALPSLKNDP